MREDLYEYAATLGSDNIAWTENSSGLYHKSFPISTGIGSQYCNLPKHPTICVLIFLRQDLIAFHLTSISR